MDLQVLLQALQAAPSTLTGLARQLGWTAGQTEAALRQLQRGGYVQAAVPGDGACQSGCSHCSVSTFCGVSAAPQLASETWRLTAKGEARLHS